jgi:uncharacterized protein
MNQSSRKFGQHLRHIFGRHITLLQHASDHLEKGFVERFSGGSELLGDFFTIFIVVDEFLHTPQLPFHARKALDHLAFFIRINQLAHSLHYIPLGVYNASHGVSLCEARGSWIKHVNKGIVMNASWAAAGQALAGGVLIGLASWLLLAALGRVAGISGIAAGAMLPNEQERGALGQWRKMFLLGLIGGGALAFALIAPPLVATRPLPLLIVAGLLVGAGTVMGSGCTSGHGVCGLGRRSARSLVATLSFMGAGVATVTVMQWIMGRA